MESNARDPDVLPQVVAGVLAVDPTATGVSGTSTIADEDLAWTSDRAIWSQQRYNPARQTGGGVDSHSAGNT